MAATVAPVNDDDRCTYCLFPGHRASHCPRRPSIELAHVLGAFFGSIAGRIAAFAVRVGNRVACHLTACHQEFRHNLIGRHDQKPHGVWECVRCGRVRLGRAIPNQENPIEHP